MSALRRLRNFWIPGVATIILGSFSNAFAQQNYKITDLGINNSKDNFSMAMGLNNQGWTENMDGTVNPPENSLFTSVARGRAVISISRASCCSAPSPPPWCAASPARCG